MGLFGPPNVEKMKVKRDVTGLIEALGYEKEPVVREEAAAALGLIGDARAVEPLIAVLGDNYWAVRMAAAESLGQIGGARAVEQLINAIRDSDSGVRKAVVGSLGSIGDALAVKALIIALEDNDAGVREAATDALGKVGRPAVEPLIAALKGNNADLRTGAVRALEKLGWLPNEDGIRAAYWIAKQQWDQCVPIGALAVDPLIDALKDPTGRVRDALANVLGKIGAPAVPSLITALKHENKYVRSGAANALGQIRDSRAVEPLIDVLRDRNSEATPDDSKDAAAALSQMIVDASAVEPLLSVLEANRGEIIGRKYGRLTVGKWVKDLLVKVGEPAVAPLVAALRDRDYEVHWGVAHALKELGWAPSQGPTGAAYRVAIEDWDACVEMGALAVEPLVEALRDHRWAVRAEVAGALKKLGWIPSRDQIGAVYWVALGCWDKCVEMGSFAVKPLWAVVRECPEAAEALRKIERNIIVETGAQSSRRGSTYSAAAESQQEITSGLGESGMGFRKKVAGAKGTRMKEFVDAVSAAFPDFRGYESDWWFKVWNAVGDGNRDPSQMAQSERDFTLITLELPSTKAADDFLLSLSLARRTAQGIQLESHVCGVRTLKIEGPNDCAVLMTSYFLDGEIAEVLTGASKKGYRATLHPFGEDAKKEIGGARQKLQNPG